MNFISKRNFIYRHKTANIRIDHLSDRQIEYKHQEYNLYILLLKYQNKENDFSMLGLPKSLEIVKKPSVDEYNIYRRTHVTINAELYKLYINCYFKRDEEFIKYVNEVIYLYTVRDVGIKEISKMIREYRLNNEI